MSPVEIGHRLLVALRGSLDRFSHGLTGRWPRMALAPWESFGFMVSDSARLFVPPIAIPTETAGLLLKGRVPAFGHWVSWRPETAFWHTDFLTGAVWPCRSGAKPDYRPSNSVGDARTVWEINRLQHFVMLAMVAYREPAKGTAAGQLITEQLNSWVRANPFPDGINHASAMEEALRVLALLHTLDLMREHLEAPAREQVLLILLTSAWDIERKLSLHSSAGNHTIAEAVGLLYLGTLLKEHRRAGRWTETARRLLGSESARQVRPDGGPLEQASWYLLFITDLMGLAQRLLTQARQPPIPTMDAAIDRARSFLNSLGDSATSLVRYGDADDGYALSEYLALSWSAEGRQPVRVFFPDTGVTVAAFEEHDRLVFLHKDLGMPPSFGHGHSDALSVTLRWRNQDVLVDPGTYLYGGDGGLRKYFRSAFAHNTVTIGGADACVQAGPFLWRRGYRSRTVQHGSDGEAVAVLAQSDGYAEQGFTHWRGILYKRNRFLAIWDAIEGQATARQVTLRWHVAGTLTPAGNSAMHLLLQEGDPIRIQLPAGTTQARRGSMTPLSGWHSPRYGNVQACETIECVLPDSRAPEAVTIFYLTSEAVEMNEVSQWVDRCRELSSQAGPKR